MGMGSQMGWGKIKFKLIFLKKKRNVSWTQAVQSHEVKIYLVAVWVKIQQLLKLLISTFKFSMAPSNIVEKVFFNYNYSTTEGKQFLMTNRGSVSSLAPLIPLIFTNSYAGNDISSVYQYKSYKPILPKSLALLPKALWGRVCIFHICFFLSGQMQAIIDRPFICRKMGRY